MEQYNQSNATIEWPFGSIDDSDLFRNALCESNYQLRMERIAQLVKCNVAFLENLE